MQSCNN